MSDLLDTIVRKLRATERRDRRYHTDCPFCGKEERKGQTHFSFCASGYYCFVCGNNGGLINLARHLGEEWRQAERYTPRPVAPPPTPRPWQFDPAKLIAQYTAHPDRFLRWGMYKPVTRETIIRYNLGIGVLPSSRCAYPRLIVPVFENGVCVALHGRAYLPQDTDAKWLTAGGSRKDVLYNAHSLTLGCAVVICENMVDCLLAQQLEPSVVAVAGGGVAWNTAWTEQLASVQPRKIVVWLDNDLAGCPNASTAKTLMQTWRAEMQQRVDAKTIPTMPSPPRPRGPQIAAALIEAGLPVTTYQWPDGTPAKADLGWAIEQQAIDDDVDCVLNYRATRAR